nr:pyocin activator PrtN family protein [Salmonella enterica]
MTKADLRLAVQRLISSSIVMLMSVISTHYDLSRISVGHYTEAKANACQLPIPTYRVGTSQKAKRCINIQDLAEYIDKRREEGRIEWERVRTNRKINN